MERKHPSSAQPPNAISDPPWLDDIHHRDHQRVLAKEVVGVFGVLDFANLTPLAGYSFLAFNLLAAPCFAAIGAIKREMNNAKWTWFAIGYQCLFAYSVALIIYQIGLAVAGTANPVGLIVAIALLGLMGFQLFRPYKEATTLTEEVKLSKAK